MNIAIIGECMMELTSHGTFLQRQFGGDTLNTAIYLRRLTSMSFNIHYVTALGSDPFSQEMLQWWQQENLNTDLVQQITNKLPGLYYIQTQADGERQFYYWRNDSAARYWLQTSESKAICQQLLQMDYLYLSGISLAILDHASQQFLLNLLTLFRQQGGKIIFDNNYRPRLWPNIVEAQSSYRQILQLTHIAFLTLDDEIALWGGTVENVIERSKKQGIEEVIIKRGHQPCRVITANDDIEIPAQYVSPAEVIDTTAAGDSFSAGYLAARLSQASPNSAAEQAHRLAATVIQYSGAIIPLNSMPKPAR